MRAVHHDTISRKIHAAPLLSFPLLYYQPNSQGLLWSAIGFITNVFLLLCYKLYVEWVVGHYIKSAHTGLPYLSKLNRADSSPRIRELPSRLRMDALDFCWCFSSHSRHNFQTPLLNVNTGAVGLVRWRTGQEMAAKLNRNGLKKKNRLVTQNVGRWTWSLEGECMWLLTPRINWN